MKTFEVDGVTWIVSDCRQYVRPIDGGWYPVTCFCAAFRAKIPQ